MVTSLAPLPPTLPDQMLHFLRTKFHAAPCVPPHGPLRTRGRRIKLSKHSLHGWFPLPASSAAPQGGVKCEVSDLQAPEEGDWAGLSLLFILPNSSHSRIIILPRDHDTVTHLSWSLCMRFPLTTMSLYHFCTWGTSTLNAVQESPPPGSPPDSLPTPRTSP